MAEDPQLGRQSGSLLVGILRRYPWSSLAIVLAVTALALVYATQFQGGTSATARISLADPRANTVLRQGVTTETSFLRYAAQRADLVTSAEVLDVASQILAEDGTAVSTDELRTRVTTTSNDVGDVIVTATGSAAGEAAAVANAVVEAYREVTLARHMSEQERAREAIEDAQDLIAERGDAQPEASPGAQASAEALARLEVRLAELLIDASTFGDGVLVVDPAAATTATGGGSTAPTILAGILLGLVLAIGVGFVRSEQLALGRPPRHPDVGGGSGTDAWSDPGRSADRHRRAGTARSGE